MPYKMSPGDAFYASMTAAEYAAYVERGELSPVLVERRTKALRDDLATAKMREVDKGGN